MGRPKGDAARTKSRPSSSSLAASQLPSGAAAVGFGGYVGSSRVDSSVPSTSDASLFLEVDAVIAQCLKRISRKDPITKIKALQLLSQLIKEKTSKEIVTIIPLWAFEYKKLLLDYNRDVRRATHETMTNLVGAVGRDLAPHLKPLMGPWWFSQFDFAYEVSQAARRSFQAAFPAPERRMDALLLYSTEIFAYIEENLKLTPQSLSDKAAASDELEEVIQQAISSSLLAFAALLDVLNSQTESSGSGNVSTETRISLRTRTDAVPNAEKLFKNHKYFLDYLKSHNADIRSATYSLLKSCIKNISRSLYEGDMKSLAGAILGSFQEQNPVCHSSMWDTLLYFSKNFSESWSAINIQKIVFNRLWNFLRNGCFGSQKVSYPALVVFLEMIPLKAITGDKFFLDFFRSLWEGGKFSHSSRSDLLAFFQAVEECFLWVLRIAYRYCDGADAILRFQLLIVNEILLGLLWCEYLVVASSSHMDITLSDNQTINIAQPTDKDLTEPVTSKHTIDYESNLGKCLVNLLSGIYSIDHDLILVFSSRFQKNCLDAFQKFEISQPCGYWAVKFIQSLDKHARTEAWPLACLVAPTLKKLFPLEGSIDSPIAVQLIIVAVSLFGPSTIAHELTCCGLEEKPFLQSFKEIIIPWCLKESSLSSHTRLDLLLGFLDDEYVTQQWDAILTYLIDREQVVLDHEIQNGYDASILSVLIAKVRERTGKLSLSFEFEKHYWHHELLDLVAMSIVRAFPNFGVPESCFLCAVLGGSSEVDQFSLLSQKTAVFIFEENHRILMSFIKHSTIFWVQILCPCLVTGQTYFSWNLDFSSSVVEAAKIFLDVLRVSLFCLNSIEAEIQLVEGIVAALFVLDWEFSWINGSEDMPDAELFGEINPRLAFYEAVHAFRCSGTFAQFLKSLGIERRKCLGFKLIESIRCVTLVEYNFKPDKLISYCCNWAIDVFKTFCLDELEEQRLLEQFLSKSDLWPIWITPDVIGGRLESGTFNLHESRNTAFVALVDRLVSELGFDHVFSGFVSPLSIRNPDVDLAINESFDSRPWLAAEILCTWKWLEGSVLHSFLNNFLEFLKNGNGIFSDAVFKILLEGALGNGVGSGLNLLWCPSMDDFDAVEGPFLRGVLCLLSSFFQHNLWGKEKASSLFELLRGKLYIGGDLNLGCLHILPYLMVILVLPLSSGRDDHRDCISDPCSQLHCTTIEWLQRITSFPPLNLWHTGEDMEDWVQLVIASFPINLDAGIQSIKPGRHVLPAEKAALYELFRKQKLSTSATVSKLPVTQKLLSNLVVISVAYCSEDFDEDDWNYALHQLRFWIGRAVVTMEEIAENVNDMFVNRPNDVNDSLSKLEGVIETCDSLPLELAMNAIVGFCLCSSDAELQDEKHSTNPLHEEKWEFSKDRIFEDILRLFFCTATIEAISESCCHEGLSIITSSRRSHRKLWELVASCAVHSSPYARDKAMKSFEFWGLSKGLISSLYAVLFSSEPFPPLQFAAFVLLSTEPMIQLALIITPEDISKNDDSNDASSEVNIRLRDEISHFIAEVPSKVFGMDLLAHERVNTLVAWCLLISYVSSLPPSSLARDRIIQYVQNYSNSIILDCLFQHISFELYIGSNSRKKHGELSDAANSVSRAVTTRSIRFSLDTLWPITNEKMTSLAGAIFGLMLQTLPAYVRAWFSDIRDRSVASAIESFTKSCCSTLLISDELLQIRKANFCDENFSISVSKVANEIVATYTKDETAMDLVIRLPQSYPLKTVDIECTKSLGISSVKQRKWLLSLMSFVRNQNGAIGEAIRIWKNNFDKEFEGVEECPICYSVIHTVSHSLPRLGCKTCKHKYHSACLHKWFSTSHKSTCPLCQSTF